MDPVQAGPAVAQRKTLKKKKAIKKPATTPMKAAAKKARRARKKRVREERTDDEVMFWFGNHLMSYFGDNGYDDEIIADLRETFPGYPFVEENFRRGLDIAIKLPGKDRRKIVQYYANRRADTAAQATRWLVDLRDKLFAA